MFIFVFSQNQLLNQLTDTAYLQENRNHLPQQNRPTNNQPHVLAGAFETQKKEENRQKQLLTDLHNQHGYESREVRRVLNGTYKAKDPQDFSDDSRNLSV